MARVLVSIKVFPSDPDINLDVLKETIDKSLPEYASVYKSDVEPVAFGLKVLIRYFLLAFPEKGRRRPD